MEKNEKYFVVKEFGNEFFIKPAMKVDDIQKFRNIISNVKLKILKLLSKEDLPPIEIARRLDVPEQNVYYHIKELEKAGIVKIVKTVNIRGTLAKFYTLHAESLVLDFSERYEKMNQNILKDVQNEKLLEFFYPHIENGKMNSIFVVGSPDPHGPYQVRARDGHYAVDLAFFLGRFVTDSDHFSVKLDVDVKAEKIYEHSNMILIGGVLTNTITQEINKYLKVKFSEKEFPFRAIYSENTKKFYEEETIGLIAKIPNPFNEEKSIIVFAGTRFSGTKASIMGVTKFYEEILKDYEGEKEWYRVVLGKDMDADGKIDSIEVIE